MSSKEETTNNSDTEYLQYVIKRAQETNFKAEEKLKRIDELAEIIFTARKNMQSDKKQ